SLRWSSACGIELSPGVGRGVIFPIGRCTGVGKLMEQDLMCSRVVDHGRTSGTFRIVGRRCRTAECLLGPRPSGNIIDPGLVTGWDALSITAEVDDLLGQGVVYQARISAARRLDTASGFDLVPIIGTGAACCRLFCGRDARRWIFRCTAVNPI